MNTDFSILLANAGFRVLGADGGFILLEDPSCVLRSFEAFLYYSWIAITAITGLLLFGWAVSLIRGAKGDAWGMAINIRNLTIIFGILAAVKPAVNLIWGDDFFAKGCKVIRVSGAEIQRILDARNLTLKTEADIYAPDAITVEMLPETPYSESPLQGSGDPQKVAATMDYSVAGRAQSSSAVVRGNSVVYTIADGKKYEKSSGTAAWRNNNPGNIICSDFARRMGAIGCNGRFAIFPSENSGMNAVSALLKTTNYQNKTVAGAISKWAPPSENNTAGYQRKLEQLTGIPINTPMASLDDAQLQKVANAIRTIEGWKPGREVEL
ncbi:MAG: hypothetical protein LBJ18_04760 [Rickettsiales bacterium]|jgi:hypothetical protein|nr:hypothetical protein [Rickettsiales bacterium]